jgi:hypothetical protein
VQYLGAETDTQPFTVPDRLTVQNIAKRRAASGKLIAGVAAVADLEAFKGRTSHLHKRPAKRWDRKFEIPPPSHCYLIDQEHKLSCIFPLMIAVAAR